MSTTDVGHVALTIDDGPSETTPELLRALVRHGLRATMFNQGNHAAARPGLVREQLAAGMWLGNHSYTHPGLTSLPDVSVHAEIGETQRVLTDLAGEAPILFRPPFGDTDDRVRAAAAAHGVAEVLWTVDTRDWDGQSAAHIVEAVAGVQRGGIILLHDGPTETIAALPGIAAVLRQRGLQPGRILVRAGQSAVAAAQT